MIVTLNYDDENYMIDLYEGDVDEKKLDDINERWNKAIVKAEEYAANNYIPMRSVDEYLFDILEDENIKWRNVESYYTFELTR